MKQPLLLVLIFLIILIIEILSIIYDNDFQRAVVSVLFTGVVVGMFAGLSND